MPMKTLLLCLICLSSQMFCFGQEFMFHIAFRDAAGNTDTLYFGYDENATDSVDAEFDETNIIETPFDSVFEVRISNEFVYRAHRGESSGSFHLKKQIVSKNCASYANPIGIDIKCNNWPVTAIWDSTIWDNNCRAGSLITGLPRGYWWDVASPSNLYYFFLAKTDSITFTSNYNADYSHGSIGETAYIYNQTDSIAVYWLVFSNPTLPGTVSTELLNHSPDLKIYPNPGKGVFKFVTFNDQVIRQIQVYDIRGKLILTEDETDMVDLGNHSNGFYFYRVYLENQKLISGKLIKLGYR